MGFSATFFVPGKPICMGSARAALIAGHPTLVQHDGSKIKTWQRQIKVVASAHAPESPLDCPVRVSLRFYLRAPKNPTFKAAPAARLDIDKLARSTLDALTGQIYRDDSRVVKLSASKVWANDDDPEGAHITVEEL